MCVGRHGRTPSSSTRSWQGSILSGSRVGRGQPLRRMTSRPSRINFRACTARRRRRNMPAPAASYAQPKYASSANTWPFASNELAFALFASLVRSREVLQAVCAPRSLRKFAAKRSVLRWTAGPSGPRARACRQARGARLNSPAGPRGPRARARRRTRGALLNRCAFSAPSCAADAGAQQAQQAQSA